MNFTELKELLSREQVSPNTYSFNEYPGNEVYQISKTKDWMGDKWEVYYAERGNKNNLVVFRSEPEAYKHFISMIIPDKTTRMC